MDRTIPLKTSYFRILIFSIALLCVGNSWADHGAGSHYNANLSVPATSSTGTYTANWTVFADQSLGESESLQEKLFGGSYATV